MLGLRHIACRVKEKGQGWEGRGHNMGMGGCDAQQWKQGSNTTGAATGGPKLSASSTHNTILSSS